MAGRALRDAGWTGRLIGLDLSRGMLDAAADTGFYDELIRCSLYDVTLAAGCAVATVSSGVFTRGHVGGEALAELCRITRRNGIVAVTQRIDMADQAGNWLEIERSTPERLHPDRDDTEQIVITWRVA